MKRVTHNEIFSTLYPSDYSCIICDSEIHPNRYGLCDKCRLFLNDNYCLRCGRHKVGAGDYCDECADDILYFDEARSAVSYEDGARYIVTRFKYKDCNYLARVMSEYMLDVLLLTDWSADCITFVPIHKKRLKKRGYNQSELLARYICERVDIPFARLLEKVTPTVNQASLNKSTRMSNLMDSFAAVSKAPDHVILIDDVFTTGATVNECSRILKKAGAKVVYVLTFASVPEKPLLDKPAQDITEFRKK